MSYTHLTSSEVIKGRQAAVYLIGHADQYGLDPLVAAKLSSLQADLIAEAEERQSVTSLPQRAVGGWPAVSRFAAKGTTADSPDAS